MIAYPQVGHPDFCSKYCALMIDIARGEETDQAKQMDFQLWGQKAGKRGAVEGGAGGVMEEF